MKQAQFTLDVESTPAGFTDITPAINRCVKNSGIQTGLLTVFVKHTSAGLTIQENADPDVLADLKTFLTAPSRRIIPFILIRTKAKTTCPPISVPF